MRRPWRVSRRMAAAGLAVTAFAGVITWSIASSADPDPGHHLMAAIAPVLAVVPDGAHIRLRQQYEPSWDSCDNGKPAGWDPVTVDIDFVGGGSPAKIIEQIRSSMRQLGWTYQPGDSGAGGWFWHRLIASHELATAQLLGGPDAQPHDWSLQASVPAAAQPIGC